MKDFFHTGKIFNQINATNLCLVPKVLNPSSPNDFRPIACCNVIYKTITQVLANRVQDILGSIISSNQGAFVEGRLIISNILICQDLVRNYHKEGGSKKCLIKIDLRMAYDSIEWSFIEQVMFGLGFPACFIQWTMKCIYTAHFSVLVNKVPHCYFKGKRGIRQGDPFSPYIFVLGMEYLSRLLNRAAIEPSFQFNPRCKELSLNHLIFADDFMQFSAADIQSVSWLQDQLECFSQASGLQVNKQKSQLFLCGIAEHAQWDFSQAVGLPICKQPVRYLGVPLLSSRLSYNDCLPVIESIKCIISSWANRFLSNAGRLLLNNSVLFHLLVYWASIFILPSKVFDTIDSLCRNFLWSGTWTCH